MTTIEIGDKVTFRQSDSINTTSGEVIEIESYGDGTFFEPFRNLYVIRDDRHGWVHRIFEGACSLRRKGDVRTAQTITDDGVPF